MNKVKFSLMATVLLCLPVLAPAQGAKSSDESSIRGTVQYYFDGISNNDVESMKKAFHPKAKYFVIRYGGLEEITQARVYGNMKDNLRRQVGTDNAPKRIVSVDITGDAAAVKIELDYANGTFTEYLSLVKFEEGWKIVSKVMSGAQSKATVK